MEILGLGSVALPSGAETWTEPPTPSSYAGDWAGASDAHSPAAGKPAAGALATPSADNARLSSARVHAALADDVYNDTPHPPVGWHVANDAELSALNLKDKNLFDQNGFRARVYEGPNEQVVIAFRGSASREDWKNDFKQGVGFSTSSYQHADKIGNLVANATVSDLSFTGHSLGGGLASAAAIVSGRPADTFNASGLSLRTITAERQAGAQTRPGAQPGRVDAWYVRGEVLSSIQDGGDHEIGSALGGLFGPAGSLLGGLADAPSAYGARHALDEIPPPGTGFVEAHDPIAMHGMRWVEGGLDKALAKAR